MEVAERSAWIERCQRSYRYYNGSPNPRDLGIAMPPHLRSFKPALGWAKIGVDKFCDRNIPIRFDAAGLLNIASQINEAIKTSVICGLSALMVYKDGGESRLRVANPMFSFVDIDANSREVTGYYESDLSSSIVVVSDGQTGYYPGTLQQKFDCKVFPIVHQQTSLSLMGESRITKPVRSLIDSAVRTLARGEIAAEFYSFPQAYLLGADMEQFAADEDLQNDVKAFASGLGKMLVLPGNERTGQNPTIGQLQQQSFTPHTDQLNQLARLCAAEMNISVSELGIYETNPTSADALYASKEDLILEVDRYQQTNEAAILGAISALIEGNELDTEPELIWAPPATPSAASQADAFSKLVSSIPALAVTKTGLRMAGLDERTVTEVANELYD